jgi:hypothetical protein
MEIAQLGDGESIECVWQAPHPDVNPCLLRTIRLGETHPAVDSCARRGQSARI